MTIKEFVGKTIKSAIYSNVDEEMILEFTDDTKLVINYETGYMRVYSPKLVERRIMEEVKETVTP